MALNFYRNMFVAQHEWFDEGPVLQPQADLAVNSSSIDTSLIDGFRQGVELTQQKYFDAGIAKISAGEPGSVLRRNYFGEGSNFNTEAAFKEKDYFSPVEYVAAQVTTTTSSYFANITFPIITSDNDQLENFVFDGVIEPLTIRSKASFFSIDIPFEAHELKGSVMGGNSDQTFSSDQVLTVTSYEPSVHQIPYLDMVDMIDGRWPLTGQFMFDKSVRTPFLDARYIRNVTSSSISGTMSWLRGNDMENVMSLMTGSTDNYVTIGKHSATSGWDNDLHVSVGTDSIAFRGMTY